MCVGAHVCGCTCVHLRVYVCTCVRVCVGVWVFMHMGSDKLSQFKED